MVSMKSEYVGGLRCRSTHGPSGTIIETDAPKDNNGKGEAFSPTDLLCNALATCALTTMAIKFEKEGVPLKGAYVDFTKEMVSDPLRRVGRLDIHFHLPMAIETKDRPRLEEIVNTCPVRASLSDKVEVTSHFIYDLKS